MRNLIFTLLFTLIAINSISQVRWGVTGGMTNSTFEEEVSSFTPSIGENSYIEISNDPLNRIGSFHLGWFIERNLVQNLFIESGMIYEKRGFSKREYFEPHDMKHTFKYKMPYLGIPITFNYYLINKKFKFYVLAGQKTGWFFNGEKGLGKNYSAERSDRVINLNSVKTVEIPVGKEGYFKSFNYDLLFGGGIGLGRFTIVGTYNLGLNNLSNFDLMEYRSRIFNLSLKMDFSKKEEK